MTRTVGAGCVRCLSQRDNAETMGRLIYAMNVSLDGYVAAPDGSLDWVNIDDEIHAWFNDGTRAVDAFLYGRRMYAAPDRG